ncbi:hypothetical protein BZL39_M05200 [Zygosaccharomyces parabailii]|nr:hypothetical protein BZL39_M05200 [Zygosaccharomyces parabailii]
MSTEKNVIVVGTGGIGTVVAYGIDFAQKSNLSIVVRRDYQKVKDVGYDIDSCDYGSVKGWKPRNIFPTVAAAAASGTVYDYVVITTKNLPDIIKVEELVEPIVTLGHTSVVLIQNGFDLCRPFFSKYPENVVISGITYCGSHNNSGNVHHTQTDKCYLGSGNNPHLPRDIQEAKTEEFVALYSNGKNNPIYITNEREYRYRKIIYNATLNTSCALTGVDTGRIELAGGLDTIVLPAMREVVAIAKADGIELPNDAINTALHLDDGEWFEPSMLVDVKKGNPIELEAILGNLLRVSKELEVDAPVLKFLYDLLKVVQYRLREKQGLFSLPKERPLSEKFYN